MKRIYLLSAEVRTVEGQLLDHAVLEARLGSVKLVTPKMKGVALGGLSLALLSSMYFGAVAVPFVFLRVPPITQWGGGSFALFIVGIPVGFFVIIFQGFGFLRRFEVKYPKTVRAVKVLETRPGHFSHELVVQSDAETLLLTIRGSRRNLARAMALAG